MKVEVSGALHIIDALLEALDAAERQAEAAADKGETWDPKAFTVAMEYVHTVTVGQ